MLSGRGGGVVGGGGWSTFCCNKIKADPPCLIPLQDILACFQAVPLALLNRWGLLFCYFSVSNTWEWWNSGGFLWPGMTDDFVTEIGHCPPLSFITSVGQVWWREPGSREGRSFIQNEQPKRGRAALLTQTCNIHSNNHLERNISQAGSAEHKKKSHSGENHLFGS